MPEIQNPSDIVPVSGAVAALISLYNQVDALFDDAKLKDQVSWELRTDLRFLPSVIAEVLPALNTGNSHFDRNFFRVVQLMCKALEEARAALDDYVLSNIHIFQARSLSRRLSDARNRIRHAVSLYNTYCNTRQLCNSASKNLGDPLCRLRDSLQELEIGSAQPCPKKILKLVAKLRANKCNADAVQRLVKVEELDHFCRVGGLEALVHLLTSPSYAMQKQALSNLHALALNNDTKQKLCSTLGTLEQLATLTASSSGEIQQEALGTLRLLLQNSEQVDARRAAVASIFPCLLSLLGNSSPFLQSNAAGLLWVLSVIPDNRSKIVNATPGAVSRLVRLFSSPSASTQFCVGAILYNLCADRQVRETVARVAGVSERLLALIDQMETPLLGRLPVQGNTKLKVEERPSAGVVGWSVAMLGSRSEEERARGLDMLQRLPEKLMGVAVSEGTIRKLVMVLREGGSAEILERATRALYRLSIPDENELRIVEEGGAVERLVELLGEEMAMGVRQGAAKALESLSFNAKNRKRIAGEEHAMDRLGALLFLDSPEAQSSAASALWNLANTNAANKLRIASCHGGLLLPRLVDLLFSDSSLVQEKAAGILMNLSYHSDNRKIIASLPSTFPRLVQLLQSSSTLVHQNAAGALYNLSVNQLNAAQIAAIPSAIPALVPLLGSMSALVQEYSAGAVANLACDEGARERMKERGAAALLKELRQSSSNAVKAQAKRAMENLLL